MNKRSFNKLSLLFFGLAPVMAFLLVSPVWADDDCRGRSCNDSGDVDVGVDVSVNSGDMVGGDVDVSHSSRALALSNSLGDVDIAGCLGSTQWNSPVFGKQKLVLNQVCMAEFYLEAGKYALAAQSLCNVPEILREFANEQECEEAHDFNPVVTEAPVVVVEDYYEEQMMEQQIAYNVLEKKVEELEKAPPQVVKTYVQQPFLSDSKRARLEALKEDEE